MTATVSTYMPEAGPTSGSAEKQSVWDYVPQVVQAYLIRSEGYQAWKARGGCLQSASERRWNHLATVSAAAAIRAARRTSRGRRLTNLDRRFREPEIGSLDTTDLAVVLFAAKVAVHTDRVTEADLERLRTMGLTAEQTLDIALAAAASCFFADAADPAAS